jgi:hypothetical protein
MEGVSGRGVSPAFASRLLPIFYLTAYMMLIMGWVVIISIGLLAALLYFNPMW